MNTLTDILVYFAKFPLRDGVIKLFNADASTRFTSYSSLKTQLSVLSPHSLVPGITDFVMGLDEKALQKRISLVTGSYLFVDYGHINSDRDRLQRQNDRIMLAITVATPLQQSGMDLVEQVLMSDQNLNMLLQIRDIMKADCDCSPFVQQLSFPNEITPFFARELSNSTGWTMVFQKTGIQLV